jgi:hypothetical protein
VAPQFFHTYFFKNRLRDDKAGALAGGTSQRIPSWQVTAPCQSQTAMQHASNFAKLFGIIVLFRSICGKALKKGGKGCIFNLVIFAFADENIPFGIKEVSLCA